MCNAPIHWRTRLHCMYSLPFNPGEFPWLLLYKSHIDSYFFLFFIYFHQKPFLFETAVSNRADEKYKVQPISFQQSRTSGSYKAFMPNSNCNNTLNTSATSGTTLESHSECTPHCAGSNLGASHENIAASCKIHTGGHEYGNECHIQVLICGPRPILLRWFYALFICA